jgi:hypothetical protein
MAPKLKAKSWSEPKMKRERRDSERIRTRVRQKRMERCKSGRLRAGVSQVGDEKGTTVKG